MQKWPVATNAQAYFRRAICCQCKKFDRRDRKRHRVLIELCDGNKKSPPREKQKNYNSFSSSSYFCYHHWGLLRDIPNCILSVPLENEREKYFMCVCMREREREREREGEKVCVCVCVCEWVCECVCVSIFHSTSFCDLIFTRVQCYTTFYEPQ